MKPSWPTSIFEVLTADTQLVCVCVCECGRTAKGRRRVTDRFIVQLCAPGRQRPSRHRLRCLSHRDKGRFPVVKPMCVGCVAIARGHLRVKNAQTQKHMGDDDLAKAGKLRKVFTSAHLQRVNIMSEHFQLQLTPHTLKVLIFFFCFFFDVGLC